MRAEAAEARSGMTEDCRNEITVDDAPKARAPGIDIARPAAAPRITVRMLGKMNVFEPLYVREKKEMKEEGVLSRRAVPSLYAG